MIGYPLTPAEAASIAGQYYADDKVFNPVQDINGTWFIFEGEINGFITNPMFNWVKLLAAAEYVPPLPVTP